MRTPFARRLGVLALLAALGACWSARLAGVDDPGPRGVLFIGNSHTYVNDVPGLVRALARLAGDDQLQVESVVQGNYALEDHWNAGRAEEVLRAYPWAFVVLQQGPSSQFESRMHLRQWTQQFGPLIRGAGAQAVLYQIWPTLDRRSDASDALASYANAAASVNGLLAPAGDAFTLALEASPPLPVYSSDGQHASVHGSYVAALVILARIGDIDPRTLPASIPGNAGRSVSAETVRQLQTVAAAALERNPARP